MGINIDGAEDHIKVDKISDDVYSISPAAILRFNVSLSKISGGKRYYYHKEYEYQSKTTKDPLITIKRSFDYYLSFETPQKDTNGEKLFIRIGAQEYFLLKNCMSEVEKWFTDKKYSKLYVSDNGKLVMTAPIPVTGIHNLPMGKYIEFSPTIIDKGMANADKEPGIRIEFGDKPNCVVTINLDRFMGLKYIIDCFNMYQAAITLLNYNNRPPYGTNKFIINNDHTMPGTDNIVTGPTGITDRFVTPKGIKNNISQLEG